MWAGLEVRTPPEAIPCSSRTNSPSRKLSRRAPKRNKHTRRSPLLNEIHNGHDRWRRTQGDTQFFEYRPQISQKSVKRLLALPDIEDLQFAFFSEHRVQLHSVFRGTCLLKTFASLGVIRRSHVLGGDVDRDHGRLLVF